MAAKPLDAVNFKRSRPTAAFELEEEVPEDQETDSLGFLTREAMLDHVQNSPLAPLCKFGLLGKVVSSEQSASNLTNNVVHGDHFLQACSPCNAFYSKYVSMDEDKCALLECMTKEQANSELWADGRRLRITASRAKSVPVQARTDPSKFLNEQLYPSFRGNNNTRHGQATEPKALEWLSSQGNITKHGMVLSSTDPWLSASPDGILDSNTLVEVKCPIVPPSEVQSRLNSGKTISNVSLKDGELVLSRSSQYYTQVQLTMHCTNLRHCKFVVFTDATHSFCLDIPFDQAFVEKEIIRLRKFYFSHMLPRLVDDFNSGRFEFKSSYADM